MTFQVACKTHPLTLSLEKKWWENLNKMFFRQGCSTLMESMQQGIWLLCPWCKICLGLCGVMLNGEKYSLLIWKAPLTFFPFKFWVCRDRIDIKGSIYFFAKWNKLEPLWSCSVPTDLPLVGKCLLMGGGSAVTFVANRSQEWLTDIFIFCFNNVS